MRQSWTNAFLENSAPGMAAASAGNDDVLPAAPEPFQSLPDRVPGRIIHSELQYSFSVSQAPIIGNASAPPGWSPEEDSSAADAQQDTVTTLGSRDSSSSAGSYGDPTQSSLQEAASMGVRGNAQLSIMAYLKAGSTSLCSEPGSNRIHPQPPASSAASLAPGAAAEAPQPAGPDPPAAKASPFAALSISAHAATEQFLTAGQQMVDSKDLLRSTASDDGENGEAAAGAGGGMGQSRKADLKLKMQALGQTALALKSWADLQQNYTKETAASDLSSLYKATMFHVIDPQKSWKLRLWDALMVVLILYIALTGPYQIVFYRLRPNGLFWFNMCVEIIFFIDTLLQLNISYFDQTQQQTITSRSKIFRQFARKWLITDIIAIIPYDAICYGAAAIARHDHASYSTRMEVLLKVPRLLKMVKIVRAIRVIPRLESSLPLDYGIMLVVEFVCMTALLSHWIACLWGLLPQLENTDKDWLTQFIRLYEPQHMQGKHFEDLNDRYIYGLCLYYTIYTLGGVGYGDVLPANTPERYASIMTMLTGNVFFGFIVGNITSIVATRNSAKNAFYKTMDELHEFMEENNLSRTLRSQLRHYFHYKASSKGSRSWHGLLSSLSPSLRAEVATQTSCQWIRNLRYFRKCEEDFLIELSMQLQPQTYTPRECIIKIGDLPNKMYIVRRGVVACEGMIYCRGGVFATDMLQAMQQERHSMALEERKYQAFALTYADVMVLSFEDLNSVLNSFPKSAKELHLAVTREVLQREICAYSRAVIRLLTGKRSRHARLTGDPNGREAFFYDKLVSLLPNQDPKQLRAAFDGNQVANNIFDEHRAQLSSAASMARRKTIMSLPFAHLVKLSPPGPTGVLRQATSNLHGPSFSAGSPEAKQLKAEAHVGDPGDSDLSPDRAASIYPSIPVADDMPSMFLPASSTAQPLHMPDESVSELQNMMLEVLYEVKTVRQEVDGLRRELQGVKSDVKTQLKESSMRVSKASLSLSQFQRQISEKHAAFG